MTTGGKQPSRDSIVEIAAAILGDPVILSEPTRERPSWREFALEAASRVMESEWGRDVARIMAEDDAAHGAIHYFAIADVRCDCCNLRYEERDEYTCCSQYDIHDHAHSYDDAELRTARLCTADCPRWWTRPDDLTVGE